MGTGIEWADETWNPLVGCAHVSPGCDNCYAAREASGRLSRLPVYAGLATAGKFTGEIRVIPERMDQPLRWRKPRRVFVNSMSDLFHQDVPVEFIGSVFAVMTAAQQHIFQVLTKRPQRMSRLISGGDPAMSLAAAEYWLNYLRLGPGDFPEDVPPRNIWLGTSIESDRYTFRADHLRATGAAIRFLSLEPLIGPVPSLDLEGIDWVIVGGESGPRARPMHPDWVRDIRDRCVEADVPFFFKQWGEWSPEEGVRRVGKRAAGRNLDGRVWDEMPS